MSASRPSQAPRVARAATRYRPGQAPHHERDTYSDDEDDEERGDDQAQRAGADEHDEPITDLSRGTRNLTGAQRRTAGIVLHTGEGPIQKTSGSAVPQFNIGKSVSATRDAVDDDSSEYETDTDEEAAAPPKPVFRRPGQAPAAPSAATPAAAAAAAAADESSEYETDSEESSEEEEEEPPKPLFKPMFKPKTQRTAVGQQDIKMDLDSQTNDEDEAERRARELAEERRKQSHQLAAQTIKRELAERDADEAKPDLDDTDGRDPDGEFAAWRIRELSRIKRDKEAAAEKEAERREIERRRAMPEEERLAEDMARAEQSRQDKKKGDMGFMEKYYHKGSFFQDMDIVNKRDYTGPTENAVDKRLLPKLMQVRDYGKASRSKWTHLANEDTTKKQGDPRFKGMSGTGQDGANTAASGSASQGCYTCGGPHLRRDCPEARSGHSQGQDRHGDRGHGRGANNVPVGVRKARDQENGRPYRDRDGEGERRAARRRDARDDRGYRIDDRERDRDKREWRDRRPCSRSRSPPRRAREAAAPSHRPS